MILKTLIKGSFLALMLFMPLSQLSGCAKTPALFEVSVTNGTGSGEYAVGENVTIKANDPEMGKEFSQWSLKGLVIDDLTKPELSFVMPSNDVTATALYKDIAYEITLENCLANKESAKYGEMVTFTANEYQDQRFTKWNFTGVDTTKLDLTKSPITISMPANSIKVTAEYKDLYKITVENGCTTDKEFADVGEQVTVTKPIAKEGYATWWVVEGLDVDWQARQNEVTFTMPANDVKIGYQTVLLQFIFTINGGTATGKKALSPNSVTDNETGFDYNCDVTITANVPTGKKFVKWTIEGVDTSTLDLLQSTLSFKMPANRVTVTANFEFINHTITIVGGTADKLTAHYGDSVKITAIIPEDKEFVMWEFEGLVADTLDITQKELTFQMPNNNVTVTAVFENKPTRLTFVSNVAESGRLTYLNNESKKFLVSMGTLGTLPVKYTFEIVGTGATKLSVFDQNGTEVTLVENTITLEKLKEDYVVILTYLGMKTASFNLKITETVVSS